MSWYGDLGEEQLQQVKKSKIKMNDTELSVKQPFLIPI